jgi:DNA invertase Pin-like site-specific DNA recombinase
MTTAIYMRVSTDKQDTESQLVAIDGWLRANGLSRDQVAWYSDPGESSAKISRPEFDRMMEAARAMKIKRIVTYKLDRIGRWNPKEWLRWRLEIDDLGVELVSILDQSAADFGNIGQQIVSIVRANGDSDWLAHHSRRIRDGLRARKLRGERVGAQPRLPPEQWAELIRRRQSGDTIVSLARTFGFNARYLARKLKGERQKEASRAADVQGSLRGGHVGDQSPAPATTAARRGRRSV